MSNCFCGNSCVVTSHHAYVACISCMRLLIDSYGREGNTDAEYDLWDRILPNIEAEPFDVGWQMANWINVFFFDGNEYEMLLAEEPKVCQVTSCLNVPDEDETICYSCWTIHDNADLPGFPSEHEHSDWLDFELSPEDQILADKADQYEVNKCSGDGESYDWREAEDFDLSVKTEGSLSGENALCDGCSKEECHCSFVDLVESDWAEEQEGLTQCTDSCKEMGMMSEGCEFCE